MYAQMETGLSPEIAYFNMGDKGKDDIIVKVLTFLCFPILMYTLTTCR